jgi:hypothetical protein
MTIRVILQTAPSNKERGRLHSRRLANRLDPEATLKVVHQIPLPTKKPGRGLSKLFNCHYLNLHQKGVKPQTDILSKKQTRLIQTGVQNVKEGTEQRMWLSGLGAIIVNGGFTRTVLRCRLEKHGSALFHTDSEL